MITEDYCSFELSKLLKEKGFDLHDTKELYVAYKDGYCVINNPRTKHYPTDEFPKATHQMALKWLREVHNKNIILDMVPLNEDSYVLWAFNIYCNKNYKIMWGTKQPKYNTYEEAVEAAIKYCLINLIK